MEEKINDFNVVLTKIVVAHKWIYDLSSVYYCPDGRKSYGLIYLLSGELEYRFTDGRFLLAKAGDWILLKPSDGYKVTCPKTCQHYTVNFQVLPSSITGKPAKKIFLSKDTEIIRQKLLTSIQTDTFERLCEIWKEKEIGYQIQAGALTYKLLFDYIKQQIPLYEDKKYIKLKPAINMLEKNWNQDISLSDLASACFLSVAHFRHLFTEQFRTSPISYRNSLRLLFAKDYLLMEGYSITEVAAKCGFNDINYFSRFFKKHTGISPSEYVLS